MAKWALLTLDLHRNLSTEQRDDFYTALHVLDWNKIKGVTTAWKRKFQDDVVNSQIETFAREDIKAISDTLGIEKCDAVIQIGRNEPKMFSL